MVAIGVAIQGFGRPTPVNGLLSASDVLPPVGVSPEGGGRRLDEFPVDALLDVPLGANATFVPDMYRQATNKGWLALHVIGVIYTFFGLAIVVDEYFVMGLEQIVEQFDIDDDVAGATFMAAGGSAPELFTSILGVFVAESDVGFGTIVGSAVFNVLFVIGLCAIFAGQVLALTWWPLFRDCSYYVLSLLILAVFVSDRKIVWWEALLLVAMYAFYVLIMAYNSKLRAAASEARHRLCGGGRTVRPVDRGDGKFQGENPAFAMEGEEEPGMVVMADMKSAVLRGILRGKLARLRQWNALKQHGDAAPHARQGKGKAALRAAAQIIIHEQQSRKGDATPGEPAGLPDIVTQAAAAHNGHSPAASQSSLAAPGEGAASATAGATARLAAVASPSKVALPSLSTPAIQAEPQFPNGNTAAVAPEAMPPAPHPEVASGGRGRAVPPGSPGVAMVEPGAHAMAAGSEANGEGGEAGEEEEDEEPTDPWDVPTSVVGRIRWVATFPVVALFWYTIPNCRKEGQKNLFMVTFGISLVWIALYSYLMVWWASVIGYTLGIPAPVMGLTILAAGTSIPDALSSIYVARMGLGDMAVSSSIGSNIYDILQGLPVPWLIKTAVVSPGSHIDIASCGLFVSVVVLLAMVLLVVVSIAALGWKIDKRLGWVCFFGYVVFVAQSLLTEYGVLGGSC